MIPHLSEAENPNSGEGKVPEGGATVILATNLLKEYPGPDREAEIVQALRGVTLQVRRGDWAAIVGPSGCGKSTLLNLLAGIDPPTKGSVSLLGNDLAQLRDSERSRLRLLRVGFVFQRFHLLPLLTASENVELPMAEAGVSRAERTDRSAELLKFVGLGHRLNQRSTRLSGGEQQRVAIARALANRPDVIFADEPTGELDQKTGAQILDLFEEVNQGGPTIVMVTHDLDAAARARLLIEMRDGLIVRETRRGA